MPQLDFDGANSKISADKIQGQSGTTVTIPAGHNLAGDGSGLTSLSAANITSGGTLPALNGSALTSLPSHSGNVAFPATQVASADANTLDDYEEGTWTPEFFGTGTAGTWVYNAANGGTYTKIGNRVFCNFALIVSSNSVAPTSKMRIKGFPFTVNGVQSRGGASVGYYAALALATQTLTISVYEGGATGGFCADATTTGTSTTADVGVFSGTSQIYGTLEYIV